VWLILGTGMLAGLITALALPPAPTLPRPARRRPGPAPPPAHDTGRPTALDGAAVAVLADRVAALTRAGLPPAETWRVLAARGDATAPLCRAVARVVSLGGTSAEGLRRAAAGGAGPVAWLALACTVSQTCGAPLAEVLDGVARTVREEQQAQRERDAALAGPRATAAVLTWLPLAGLGLGALTGTNSLTVLVTTGPGQVCLAIGGCLWWTGRWWMSQLLRRAEGSPR
jgi:tight adherence protein B